MDLEIDDDTPNDETDLDATVEGDELTPEGGDGAGAGGDADTDAEVDDGEVEITIGDEPVDDPLTVDAADDSSVIKQLRAKVRESTPAMRAKERELKQLREELERVKGATAQPDAIEVGEEPDLDKYETWEEAGKAKFKADYAAWNERKTKAEELQRQREQSEQQQRQQWQTRINAVDAAATGIKVTDYKTAAEAFDDTFALVQKGIIIGGPAEAKDSALLRYALGKNPAVAKKLADIKDPVRFTWEVARVFFKELNVKSRKAPPAPDTVVRSAVSGAAAVDSQLKRLQEQADKTGDRSKVAAYLRQKNKQSA